jgi:hypothetical protein
MSFANLKSKSMDVSKLVNAAAEMNGTATEKKGYGDDRFWKPTVDESGNGYAVIRFLPAAEGSDLPWARYWDHFFKGPTGQWYIEKSLTTIGQNDPVSELNSRLWNSGVEDDKEVARKQKRRLHYVANVLVVNDPANTANNGKVFLFDFGKKIFDKIMDVMQPQFPGEEPINPFDFWNGSDFQLKIRNVAGYRNYDKSEFKAPSALFEADEVKLEATYNQLFDLSEFTNPTTFKSYDELKGRLQVVLGTAVGSNVTARNEALTQTAEVNVGRSAPEPEIVAAPSPSFGAEDDEDDGDTLSYFAKMAQED